MINSQIYYREFNLITVYIGFKKKKKKRVKSVDITVRYQ